MDTAARRRGPTDGSTDDGLRLMRGVAVCMLLVGALTSVVGVFIIQSTHEAPVNQVVCSTGFLVCGLGLAVARLNCAVIAIALAVSIAILSVLMAGSNPIGMGPFFYLWPIVYAAYFFGAVGHGPANGSRKLRRTAPH